MLKERIVAVNYKSHIILAEGAVPQIRNFPNFTSAVQLIS
jgi:hypothetical protein